MLKPGKIGRVSNSYDKGEGDDRMSTAKGVATMN